ncbi:MAG: 3-hydroxyacyl-ACP dehydratase FabZ [Kiritimatiellia bacterium]
MSTITIDEIMKILPHRYPMLLVDRIVECDDREHIVGIKNVTANEPFFQGHFPGAPIMPGVLQLEAMAQTGGILLVKQAGGGGRIPYFMSIDRVKFRRVVKPGDQLRIEVDILNIRSKAARFRGKITVDGAAVSEAELACMITSQEAEA